MIRRSSLIALEIVLGLMAALALPGAQVWHPPGQKRAMSKWVQVPFVQAEHWPQLAEQSLAFVAS